MEKRFTLQQIVVFTGGLLGLIAGIVIGLGRFGVLLFAGVPADPQPPPGDSFVGQAAFLLVFTLPSVVSLLALRTGRNSIRSIVWIGAGLLVWIGAMSAFSGLAIYLLPLPGVLLLIGGGIAFTRPDVERAVLVAGLALVFVAGGVVSFAVLFTEENPVCWSLVRLASGEDVWQVSEEGIAPITISPNPGIGQIVSWSCASDVINLREGSTGMAVLAAMLLGLAAVSRWKVLE